MRAPPAHAALSRLATETSSSRSGQWMPCPRPIRRQFRRCSGVALARRGNHASGAATSRPSASTTRSRSSVTVTSTAVGSTLPAEMDIPRLHKFQAMLDHPAHAGASIHATETLAIRQQRPAEARTRRCCRRAPHECVAVPILPCCRRRIETRQPAGRSASTRSHSSIRCLWLLFNMDACGFSWTRQSGSLRGAGHRLFLLLDLCVPRRHETLPSL
jgi:hypothetical protein